MIITTFAAPGLFVANAEGPNVVTAKTAECPDVVKGITAAQTQLEMLLKLAAKTKKHHVICRYKVSNSLTLFPLWPN